MIFALLTLVATVAVASPSPAPVPISAAVATPDPLAYDDAALHFRAPDGWKRIPVPPGGDNATTPVAVFAFHPGQYDERTIMLSIAPYDGTLEGYDTSRESELRSGGDGTFVTGRKKITLANGMPGYAFKVSGEPSIGAQRIRYDYVFFDLTRGIDIAYLGRPGDVDEDTVRKAFASLYVVVYPRNRP